MQQSKQITYNKLKQYIKFLQLNKSLIQSKFYQFFQKELADHHQLHISNIQKHKIEKFIKQIMISTEDFNHDDFYQKLDQNISNFQQSNKLFNIQVMQQLIYFCVENSFTQDVRNSINRGDHRSQQSNNTENNPQNNKNDKKSITYEGDSNHKILKQKGYKNEINSSQSLAPKKQIAQIIKQNIEQYEKILNQQNLSKQQKVALQQALTNLKIQLLTIKRETKKKKLISDINEEVKNKIQVQQKIKPPQPTPEQKLKKQLRKVFYFYCSQQQVIGNASTFDHIKNQNETMNLGKFIMFCNCYGIINQKLNRAFLIQKFKKLSEGNQQIGFQKFYKLIETLRKVQNNSKFYDSMLVNQNSSKFKDRLKYLALPFNIRDKQQFRAARVNSLPKKQPTSHSGQLGYSLKQELEFRKELKSSRTKDSNDRYLVHQIENNNINKRRQSIQTNTFEINHASEYNLNHKNNIFTLNNLKNIKIEKNINKLNKFIISENDDDQWLKQYKIDEVKANRDRNLVDNIYKRVNQLTVLQKNSNHVGNIIKQKRRSNLKIK